MFSLSAYTYHLPKELIAQEAIHPHHDARMMIIDRTTGDINNETTFWNLDKHLQDDRVIFFNDSKVMRSRVTLENIAYEKPNKATWILTDGEIFYLSAVSENTFSALVRPGNKFKIGTIFQIHEYTIEVIEITESGRILKIQWWDISHFLEKYGSLPLPPYITYSKEKEIDYQTSFAKTDGSVAAPTASLHFTKELMEKIPNQKEFLTLHVGLGTFKWIQTPDIRDYAIHAESIEISIEIFEKIANIRENNQKIVAVGTTATRTLESLPYLWLHLDENIKKILNAKTCEYWNTRIQTIKKQEWIHSIRENPELWVISFETSIYITPGYQFLIVDDLITNFHLSESSLLVLISAFVGYEETQKIYKYAIDQSYRFYSFGDGMYIRWK